MNTTYFSLAVVIFLIVLVRFVFPGLLGRSGPTYRRHDSLFTPAEFHFLHTLRAALPAHLEVFGKVRVADVLRPVEKLDRKAWRSAFNRITGKHLDFVLCERDSGRLVCALELNDRSHSRLERQERDQFIVTACREASFPLLMIPAARIYEVEKLRSAIVEAIENLPTTTPSDVPSQDTSACPQCGGPLERKVARRGAHAGKAFLACSRYPDCRHTQEG
jgi:hypothetical protein